MECIWDHGHLSILENGSGWKNITFEWNGQIWDGFTGKQRVETEIKGNGIIVRRFIRGPAQIRTLSDSADFQLEGELRYYHSSNIRTEKYPVSTQDIPLIRSLPVIPHRFNDGEGNPFPAFAIFDKEYHTLLIEGDLDQTRFRRLWELDNSSRYAIERYDMASAPVVIAENEELEVSRVYYEICRNIHVQYAFDGYIHALKSFFSFAAENSAMLHGGVFCTWNYGTMEKINETLLLKRAQALSENLPECTHFLVDDGYQANRKKRYAGIDSFYPDPKAGYNRKLFPHGMRFLADTLKAMQLKPAIWLSPAVYLDSFLALEHPEWLMLDAEGKPELIGKTSYLDLSIPEAQDFMLSVLDTLFLHWGFCGLKFDFMTQYFTLEKGRFQKGSGCEWRDWLFTEIRQRIGQDGLFMTCIAMSMGNPFPGRFADCYRCGCDIHSGTKKEQLRACHSTLPQILLPGRELFLLNMDSIGFGTIPQNELHFRFVWGFITQGILEFGGPAESLTQEQFTWWRKLFQPEGRGNKVECLDEKAFLEQDLPRILCTGKFTAFFNWDENKFLSIRLKNKQSVSDYFTGQIYPDGEIILPPFSAILTEGIEKETIEMDE